jgi:hypothetical protein
LSYLSIPFQLLLPTPTQVLCATIKSDHRHNLHPQTPIAPTAAPVAHVPNRTAVPVPTPPEAAREDAEAAVAFAPAATAPLPARSLARPRVRRREMGSGIVKVVGG